MDSIPDIQFRKSNAMYDSKDKSSAVRDVQRMLRFVQRDYKINISGHFDSDTRRAIIKFQKVHHLEDTGIVDEKTLGMIVYWYGLFWILQINGGPLFCYKLRFPLKIGDVGEFMIILHSIMKSMTDKYRMHCRVQINRIFGKETQRVVNELRKIYMLSPDDVVDEEFCARLLSDYYSDKKIDV